MSIFVKNLKTMKTDITGDVIELKNNLAVWLFLEADYGIKQAEWLEVNAKEGVIALAKFLASILKANGYETDYKEVLENTSEEELTLFTLEYQKMTRGDITMQLIYMLDVQDKNLLKSLLIEKGLPIPEDEFKEEGK